MDPQNYPPQPSQNGRGYDPVATPQTYGQQYAPPYGQQQAAAQQPYSAHQGQSNPYGYTAEQMQAYQQYYAQQQMSNQQPYAQPYNSYDPRQQSVTYQRQQYQYQKYGEAMIDPQYHPPKQSLSARLIVPLGVLTFVSCIALAIVGFLIYDGRPTPAKTFQAFLQTIHSTRQVKQTSTTASGETVVQFDLTDVQNPVVSTSAKQEVLGEPLEAEGFGTKQDTYIKFSKLATISGKQAPSIGKWIHIRDTGVDPRSVDSIVSTISDPTFLVFNHFIIGNFGQSDQSKLHELLRAALQYESNAVTKEKLPDGTENFVYTINQQPDQHKDYLRHAAELMQFDQAKLESRLAKLASESTTYKLHIAVDTGRPIKLVATISGIETTVNFSDFNAITMPTEPTSTLPYDTFQTELYADIAP